MSVKMNSQLIRNELQNELITVNQLLFAISKELAEIKEYTKSGGQFEKIVKKNTSTVESLWSLVDPTLDINNLLPTQLRRVVETDPNNESEMNEINDTLQDASVNDSQ